MDLLAFLSMLEHVVYVSLRFRAKGLGETK